MKEEDKPSEIEARQRHDRELHPRDPTKWMTEYAQSAEERADECDEQNRRKHDLNAQPWIKMSDLIEVRDLGETRGHHRDVDKKRKQRKARELHREGRPPGAGLRCELRALAQEDAAPGADEGSEHEQQHRAEGDRERNIQPQPGDEQRCAVGVAWRCVTDNVPVRIAFEVDRALIHLIVEGVVADRVKVNRMTVKVLRG